MRITAITKSTDGWEYTVDVPEGDAYHVFDVNGDRLFYNLTTSTFEIVTTAMEPPLVCISYDTDDLNLKTQQSRIASNRTVLQWLNMGAEGYAVERYDTDTWTLMGVVTSNDLYLQYSLQHATDADRDDMWRITPCALDGTEIRYTGQPVQFQVISIGLPTPPSVQAYYSDGNVIIEEVTTDIGSGEL